MSGSRLLRHERVAPAPALRADDTLAALVGGDARPGAAGIGGRTATLDVAGVPVFVKQVPVTALDLRHPHATANLFGAADALPVRGRLDRLRRLFLGPPGAEAVMRRYARRALVTGAFFDALVTGDKTAPYPDYTGTL